MNSLSRPIDIQPLPRRAQHRAVLALSCLVLLVSLLIGPVSPAAALTIELTLSPDSDSPNFDLGAVELTKIMQAAADHWSSIIKDDFTLEIVYGYKDLSNQTFLGQACFLNPDGTCFDGAGGTLVAMPDRALIAVDTKNLGVDRLWFMDPTPMDHSEFAMQQRLYRELRNDQMSNYFNNTGLDLLEIGFTGDAVPAAPVEARDGIDMLSLVLHEMGHTLGLINELRRPGWNPEFIDLDPMFVAWNSVTTTRELSSISHLRADETLMSASVKAGRRRLPSALDVFAVAAVAGWQDIELPRRDFWGGLLWNLPGAWGGHTTPTSTTDAWVRSGGDAVLIADGQAKNLVVSGDSQLLTSGFDFTALGYVTVEQGAGVTGSRIEVEDDFQAGVLRVRDGGTVDVVGGHAQALAIETEPGGVLTGYGNATMWALDNDGLLAATASGPFIINTGAGSLDLDGNDELGEVQAVDGDLVLADSLSDAFDGVMTVGGSRSVDVTMGWSLGENGQLNLNGSPDGVEVAQIEGGAMILAGALDVSGRGRIDAPLTVQSSALVDIANDSELELDSATEFSGGNFTGLGMLQLNGPTTVSGGTTLSPSIVDLDGQTGNTVITLANRALDLQVDRINPFNNTFDGTLHIGGLSARLGIQLNDPSERWTLDGSVHIAANNFLATTQLSGSDVIVKGTVEVDGTSRLGTNLDLIGTLTTVDGQAEARLSGGGINIFRHTADVTGPGWVVVESGTTLQLEQGFNEWMRLRNQGNLEPGVGVGMARLLTYSQTSGGHLGLELAGTTAVTEHDQLKSIGNVQLDGGVNVQLAGGFVPTLGDSFVVLTTIFGTITGTWNPALSNLPALPAGLAWQVIYQNKSVNLQVVQD